MLKLLTESWEMSGNFDRSFDLLAVIAQLSV